MWREKLKIRKEKKNTNQQHIQLRYRHTFSALSFSLAVAIKHYYPSASLARRNLATEESMDLQSKYCIGRRQTDF